MNTVRVGASQHEAGSILRGKSAKGRQCLLVAKVYTAKKKSIFVGLNFYLNPNTVRAV